MPTCLHCGELAPDGALFCAKCGFTLPQSDPTVAPVAAPPPPAPIAPPAVTPVPIASAAAWGRPYGPPGPAAYPMPATPPGGATGPMAPPPSGKYCIRCRTVISRSAVYCPVCQQPQGP